MKLRKQIRGYEGLYEVCSDGSIISMPREKRLPNGKLCRSKERIMSPARIGEDVPEEEWRAIPGYEGYYEVSSLGKVRSLDKEIKANLVNNKYVNRPGRLLKQKEAKGYKTVSLCVDYEATTWRVHRLVAMAFIPNPDSKPQVNHIDGNPANNCVNNLEWCTAKENQWHRRNILGKTSNGRETPVRCVELGWCFPTIQGAADWLGLQKSHICHCLKGNRNTTGGYHFEPCTKEEAEKAVEKLKAFKRLKDKGFSFDPVDRYEALCGNGFNIPITATMPPEAYTDTEVSKDLDICFGGEE